MLLLHCYPLPAPKSLYNFLLTFSNIPVRPPGFPFQPHDTPSLTHLCSTIFLKLILCAPLILRYLLRLQCPSRTLDLQYLTFPPHPLSTYLRSSLSDTATSAVKATPSASGSTTPTSSLPRDPGGEAELQGQGIYIYKAGTNLMQHEDRANTYRFCCRRPYASTRVLHQRSQGWRSTEWGS